MFFLFSSFFFYLYRERKKRRKRILVYCFISISVRGARPGKNVQLTEGEIRGLCLKSREIFLSQPILLELEAPLKICGKFNRFISQQHITCPTFSPCVYPYNINFYFSIYTHKQQTLSLSFSLSLSRWVRTL